MLGSGLFTEDNDAYIDREVTHFIGNVKEIMLKGERKNLYKEQAECIFVYCLKRCPR